MPRYDPMQARDPAWWLSLDEAERIVLVTDYHRRAREKAPSVQSHVAIHAVVETQVAMGDELPVTAALARFQAEGLDRHDALHAIGSVLAENIYNIAKGKIATKDANQPYWAALERLSAKSWRRSR
jgi:hypothetical protein